MTTLSGSIYFCKWLPQGHTSSKWQSQAWCPSLLTPESACVTLHCCLYSLRLGLSNKNGDCQKRTHLMIMRILEHSLCTRHWPRYCVSSCLSLSEVIQGRVSTPTFQEEKRRLRVVTEVARPGYKARTPRDLELSQRSGAYVTTETDRTFWEQLGTRQWCWWHGSTLRASRHTELVCFLDICCQSSFSASLGTSYLSVR